jgi:hypothetical protein
MRYSNNRGPFPSDFETDYETDYKTPFRNWGTNGRKPQPQWSKEFGAWKSPFRPNFDVCQSQGGKAYCPPEYVKEFGGLGEGMGGKWPCVLGALVTGVLVGRYLLPKVI